MTRSQIPNGRRQTESVAIYKYGRGADSPGYTNLKLRWLIRTKHFPDSKTLPRIQTHPRIWILESVFEFWDVFGFREVFLDSGKCFWILGNVFGFWEVFLDSGKCCWVLGRVLESGKCVVLTSHRMKRNKMNYF